MIRSHLGNRTLVVMLATALGVVSWSVVAQDEPKGSEEPAGFAPEPTKEHQHLRKDVGVWDAEVKLWMDPAGEPEVSKGVERNRMMGPFWLISDFEGSMAGTPFRGHSVSGYDPAKKQYVGNWVDTMSTGLMLMEGAYNEDTGELVMEGETADPRSDITFETRSVGRHNDDGTRVFTLYMKPKGSDGEAMKSMEITYTRRSGPATPAKKAGERVKKSIEKVTKKVAPPV